MNRKRYGYFLVAVAAVLTLVVSVAVNADAIEPDVVCDEHDCYEAGPDFGPDPGTEEWCRALDYPNNFCLDRGWVPYETTTTTLVEEPPELVPPLVIELEPATPPVVQPEPEPQQLAFTG